MDHKKTEMSMWNCRFLFSLVLAAIFFFSLADVFAIIPEVYINETGNLTRINTDVYGNFTLESGIEYRSLRLKIGDLEYIEPMILDNESFSIIYSGNKTHRGIEEKIVMDRFLDNITKAYNVTNLFNETAKVNIEIDLPNASKCSYSDSWFGFTPDGFDVFNQTVYMNITLDANESKLFNITCETPSVFGYLYFPETRYNMSVANFTYHEPTFLKVLPDARTSVTKEMFSDDDIFDYDNETSFRNWSVHFSFVNDGNLSVNITDIHLWATPAKNTTNDPTDNIIFSRNYTSCLSGDNQIDQNEFCEQMDMFNSYEVPVMWSEVFFDNLFDIFTFGRYHRLGKSINFSIAADLVTLFSPENMTLFDVNETINMSYFVRNTSTCNLLTNDTGHNLTEKMTHNNVTAHDSFYYPGPSSENLFAWNVFCRLNDGSEQGYGNESWFIYVNGKPRIYDDYIPDMNWSEDTNLSVNLTDYFFDLEDEDINFTILPNNIQNISYELDNISDMVKFIPDPDWYGTRLIQIRSTDEFGRNTTSNLIYLNVTNVYDPPEIIWWNASNATWSTDNETNLTFKENETISFEAEAKDPDIFGIAPASWFYWFMDGMLQSVGKAFDWAVGWFEAGQHNVTLMVNDTEGLFDYQTWTVNITNVNRAPKYDPIPPLQWKENTTLRINLSRYFYDLDLEELDYSTFGMLPENITINISNETKIATFTPDPAWVGKDNITFMAIDPWNATNTSNNVSLEVYPYMIKTIPNITFIEDTYNDSLNLSEHYNDYYDKTDMSWSINGSDNVMVSINLLTWQVNFTSRKDWYGNESINFRLDHVSNYTDNQTINIEVLPENDPPEINGTSRVVIEDSVPPENLIDLWTYSFDVDNTYEELDYTIISNTNSSLLACSIVGDRYINCTPPAPGKWGEIKLNVSVDDGEYQDDALMNITVFHHDLPPQIPDWHATNGTKEYSPEDMPARLTYYENTWINWTADIFDHENDNLSYRWKLNGTTVHSGNLTDTRWNQTINFSYFFDYHSAGDHVLELVVNQTSGDIPGLKNRTLWRILILNNNRAPSKVNLTTPVNNSYVTVLPAKFSWTESIDPDALNHTPLDFWDVSYILQIDDDPKFYSPEYQAHVNSTEHDLKEPLEDGMYFWRVISTDGDENVLSDVFMNMFDVTPPEVELDISPNPAEHRFRDVDISWNATDRYLEDAYLRVFYPNGTLLGNYTSREITLTPAELTLLGIYDVVLYARDNASHESVLAEGLQIINDTTPPDIELISPKDMQETRSTTTIFSYTYEDYATLKNCSLYYQEVKIYRDILGNVIYIEPRSDWEPKSHDLTIDEGKNYFVMSGMDRGEYRWNVLCHDLAGNSASAPENRSFIITSRTQVEEDIFKEPSTIESSERIIEKSPGYRLRIELPIIHTVPGKELELNFTLINPGEQIVRDIDFFSPQEWIDVDTSLSVIQPGEKIGIPFKIRVPYELGDKIYRIAATSEDVDAISGGVLNIGGKLDEPPIYVIKRVEPRDGFYNITISVINSLHRKVRLYVEDYITGMREISFEDSDFSVNIVKPPALVLNISEIESNTVENFTYTVKDLSLSELQEPFVITDEDSVVELQIVDPTRTSIAFFSGFSMEYVILIFMSILFLLWLYWKKQEKKRKNEGFSRGF